MDNLSSDNTQSEPSDHEPVTDANQGGLWASIVGGIADFFSHFLR